MKKRRDWKRSKTRTRKAVRKKLKKNARRKTRRKRRNPLEVIEIVPPHFREIVKKICHHHHHRIGRIRDPSNSSDEIQSASSHRKEEIRSCANCHRKWYTYSTSQDRNEENGKSQSNYDEDEFSSSTFDEEPRSHSSGSTYEWRRGEVRRSRSNHNVIHDSSSSEYPSCRRCPEDFDIAQCHRMRMQATRKRRRSEVQSFSGSSSGSSNTSCTVRTTRKRRKSEHTSSRPTATQSDLSHVIQEVLDIIAGRKENPKRKIFQEQTTPKSKNNYCRCKRCGNWHKVGSTKEHHQIHAGHMQDKAKKKYERGICKTCGRSKKNVRSYHPSRQKSIKIIIKR